jgi:hypothetical protein
MLLLLFQNVKHCEFPPKNTAACFFFFYIMHTIWFLSTEFAPGVYDNKRL